MGYNPQFSHPGRFSMPCDPWYTTLEASTKRVILAISSPVDAGSSGQPPASAPPGGVGPTMLHRDRPCENGHKCSKSRVLPTPLESCTRGHKASKISRVAKIVGYNPRKRQEMAEITTFVDARFLHRFRYGLNLSSLGLTLLL